MVVQRMRESEADLEREALELAQVMVRDLDGRIQLWTDGMRRLYGYTAAEAVGQISHRLLDTVFPQPLAQIESEMLKQGRWSGELVQRRCDSTLIVVASRWCLSRSRDGLPRAVTEVSNDITGQKHGEEARHHLAALVDSSEDAIISKTLAGVVTSWNKAAETMFGYAAEEIIGRAIGLLLPPDRIGEEELILERLRRGERIDHYETVRRRKDGQEIHVSVAVSPIRNLAGDIVAASTIVRDITAQKLTQARLQEVHSELLHISRLSTMGQMASTLAHELNQPLSALRNYLAALRRLVGAPQSDPKKIGEIIVRADEQAARAGDVIRHLREFVVKGETERRLEDLNAVVRQAAALGMIGVKQQGISASMRLAEGLPPVLIDRVQTQQVVLNLVRNAVEAMEATERQELAISTARRSDMQGVEISVADTGAGIAADVAERLFQPFVSSKKSGMGIGLAISKEIVEAHGGRLSVAPNMPTGTVFTVLLPIWDGENGR